MRELRLQLAAHQERVLTAARPGGGCPLDLHRLVPVPRRRLMLGFDAPESWLWLRTHWAALQPLRQVRVLGHVADARLKRIARVARAFWWADWTPWRAITRLRQDWPGLRLGRAAAGRHDPTAASRRPRLAGGGRRDRGG